MNQEIKSRWVIALRSGRYAECRSVLRNGELFDSLGVLCDLVRPDGWEGNEHFGHRLVPSGRIALAADLQVTEMLRILDLEDVGKTFADIADRIEEHL